MQFLIAVTTLSCLFTVAVWGGREPLRRVASRVNDPESRIREEMKRISRQLGVTCNYCHNPNDLKDSSLRTYQISKRHMELVLFINSDAKKRLGHTADCYMCHRGQAKFAWKEVVGVAE